MLPPHQLCQLAGNGGAQACAAKAAGGGGIGLREGRKNVFELVRGNANARVLDAQVQHAVAVIHL